MKIALISCGRSDFSIYRPLIKRLLTDAYFDLHIIAFGTHVSQFYDKSVSMFHQEGFNVAYEIESLVLGESSEAIASAMGLTTIKFASVWAKEQYDMIVVLGDRYEMFAAISASVPFNITVAHLHGGETTLGAIDDKFRHCLTSMSQLHFTSTEKHADRVKAILGYDNGVYNVGAPALDNLNDLSLMDKSEFRAEWGIDLSIPTVLVTYHPETVALEKNIEYVSELCAAMAILDMQFVITMPNNDTMGEAIRKKLYDFAESDPEKFKLVEVLGVRGYYSCISHCEFLLGNTSSGIIEAASFGRYVINLGDRQKGRQSGENVIHVTVEKNTILKAVEDVKQREPYTGGNIYGGGDACQKILDELKHFGLSAQIN